MVQNQRRMQNKKVLSDDGQNDHTTVVAKGHRQDIQKPIANGHTREAESGGNNRPTHTESSNGKTIVDRVAA